MSTDPETVQIELGFEGSGVLRCTLPASELARLEHAYAEESPGPLALAADEGKLTVDLRRVVYVRQLRGSRPVSFTA
ncbi:MAG: hypothetical protein ACXVZP_07275 [Gaiellaceae bacterium]